jgi:hypothetical protein
MILWISGIIEAELNVPFLSTMKFIQPRLNDVTTGFDNDSIQKIRFIFILNRDPVTEYKRFNKKAKILDARVRIDYEEFRDSSDLHRVEMFINAIIVVIEKIEGTDTMGFSKDELINQLKEIALQAG